MGVIALLVDHPKLIVVALLVAAGIFLLWFFVAWAWMAYSGQLAADEDDWQADLDDFIAHPDDPDDLDLFIIDTSRVDPYVLASLRAARERSMRLHPSNFSHPPTPPRQGELVINLETLEHRCDSSIEALDWSDDRIESVDHRAHPPTEHPMIRLLTGADWVRVDTNGGFAAICTDDAGNLRIASSSGYTRKLGVIEALQLVAAS